MSDGWETKRQRLVDLLEQHGWGTLVLSRLDNLFWLCGVDAHVGLATEQAVATAVVTRRAIHLVTTNIEAPRLLAEEVGDRPLEVHAVNWWDGDPAAVIADLADEGPIAADTPGAGRALVDLAPLRYALVPEEVAAYRALGADMGALLGEVARAVEPGETEFAAAGRLARGCLERGITPVVLLVAADERMALFRHPIPTDKPITERVMLVASGRRHGLIVALTRIVSFGEPPAELRRRHEAVCAVDAALIGQTLPGACAGAIFAAGVAAYEAAGYPDEWRLHHQGGATGYAGRDYKATLASTQIVQPWQPFAWNPSIAGTKSEDTLLAAPAGPEIVSASPDWPLLEVEAAGRRFGRPEILVR